jgi:hypothetical protein
MKNEKNNENSKREEPDGKGETETQIVWIHEGMEEI